MNMNCQRVSLSVCGTVLLGLLVPAGVRAQAPPPKAPPESGPPKLAEEEYKNIQALKGIPAEQVIPSMQFIAASLGVECEYISTIGGAEALEKITSRVQKGTLTAFGGQHFPVDVYSKAPDKRVSVMHLSNGDSVTAFDGKQGWLSVPGRVHMMSAAENAAARIDADLYFPVRVKTLYEKFRVDAGEKIDGHDTYLVLGRSEGQPPLRLYFDKDSGLLLRLVRYAETPLGRNPTQIDYADYREANGLKVPFRWTLSRPGNQFTIQVEQLQQNVPVDDAKIRGCATAAGTVTSVATFP
jgi:hypothetical protein